MSNNFLAGKEKGDVAERHVSELFLHLNLEFVPFGYENTHPRLAELQRNTEPDDEEAISVYKRIRSMPDYAVVNHDTGKMFLVEIKYRSEYSEDEVKKIADKVPDCWDVSYLFLVTPKGFFIKSIKSISSEGSSTGVMDVLPQEETNGIRLWSPEDVQRTVLDKINSEIESLKE